MAIIAGRIIFPSSGSVEGADRIELSILLGSVPAESSLEIIVRFERYEHLEIGKGGKQTAKILRLIS